uniref:Uncharacterized protein n=1 Tax=Cyanistes caeruleus TaxID=156563 RepID=A0A8C0VSL8_CYACU
MTHPNILPQQRTNTLNLHRPNLRTLTSLILLTTPTHNHSKPKSPRTRAHQPQTNLPHNINPRPTIHPPSLLSLRTNTILHRIRGHPNPHAHPNHSLRQPTRTPKRRHLPSILHPSQLPTPAHRHPAPP